ncbi:MAG: Kdo hydroxylase family protein [Pseudomonadota bacterium]
MAPAPRSGPPDSAELLEGGEVLFLPDRPFLLTQEEAPLLSPRTSDGRAKNISLDPATGAVRGAAAPDQERLAGLLARYADWARILIGEVAPGYAPALRLGRTSYRPRAVDEAAAGPRKDDRRLHADAFPSQPTRGWRILRVFSNVDPAGEPRIWRIGEPFEAYARRWIGEARRMAPLEAWLLHRLGITKSRRSDYDAAMLALHDHAKLDADYQATAPRREMVFPAGSSWVVFTDAVVHAAIGGRYALEQTFYVPPSSLACEAVSPLRILERLTGRALI